MTSSLKYYIDITPDSEQENHVFKLGSLVSRQWETVGGLLVGFY